MKFGLTLSCFCIALTSWGQVTVEGTVCDRQGLMPGVVVSELNSTPINRVVTNSKGEFKIITIQDSPVLTFEYIGCKTRIIEIKKKFILKVKMKFEKAKGRHISFHNQRTTETPST